MSKRTDFLDNPVPAAESQPTETKPVTPAEYIYNSLAPPSNSPPQMIRERCNTGGSIASLDNLMDLFMHPEDLEFDGGRIKSSDFVMDLLKADQVPNASNERQRIEDVEKIENLAAKPERISSLDITSLKGSFRLSSRDWIRDFDDESVDMGPMHPSLFMVTSNHADVAAQMTQSPPPLDSTYNYQEYQIPFAFSEYDPLSMPPLPIPDASASTCFEEAQTSSRKKKRKPRAIDESYVAEPTAGDVLFGRGGKTNIHPGNIKFRKKVLELRPWYEQSSKEEKQRIADILVEYVKGNGDKFLEKGKDGLWHEVIGKGTHTKASQALRERISRKRKTSK